MERNRLRDPAPHVSEHELHASHALCEQSIGHANVLQLRASMRTGQEAPPPLLAASTERPRLLVAPVPQLTEQADHPPQAPTAQSTGHNALPHSAMSEVSGQLSPSPTCGCVTRLVRTAVPESQLREHVPHAAHAATAQLTGIAKLSRLVGVGVGSLLGGSVGMSVGTSVGSMVGVGVGSAVGNSVGVSVGKGDGSSVGVREGANEGLSVVGGRVVGTSVGAWAHTNVAISAVI
jgi:hypothetical protein